MPRVPVADGTSLRLLACMSLLKVLLLFALSGLFAPANASPRSETPAYANARSETATNVDERSEEKDVDDDVVAAP